MIKSQNRKRIAVVLFNLGGPDSLEAVRPFLFNLFRDPAIIRLPQPLRWLLARLISKRREPEARKIYESLGGRSPLLEETTKQAQALEERFAGKSEARVFVAMRYWRPRARETAGEVKKFAPDQIILLPLYPQYSTTTTASSLRDWNEAAREAGLGAPAAGICCYPAHSRFAEAHAGTVLKELGANAGDDMPRLLFSAHGLPEKIVREGDPYAWQVERTVAAVVGILKERLGVKEIDHTICYQSRVGPMKWLEPSTEEEIERAGREGRAVLVVPITFVSEHSETLYELDLEYGELARDVGVPSYGRVPALGVNALFIDGLAELVARASEGPVLGCGEGERCCPQGFKDCPLQNGIS